MRLASNTSMIVGADGCPGGWLCVADNGSDIVARIVPTIREALDAFSPEILAVDIPIGLTDAGPRECDLAARRMLGKPRSNSVFSAPVRAALKGSTYAEASAMHAAADGRRMTRQAFGIMPKICEVDALLSGDRELRSVVREVHPELCFAQWNNGQPMLHPKRKSAGRAERQALIDAKWPGVREDLLRKLGRTGYAPDDLHDALAALWTAERIRDASAMVIPNVPPVDSVGLRMEMWV